MILPADVRLDEWRPKGHAKLLTSWWQPLRYVREQYGLWSSHARFRVVVAGRRSGKTDIAKRNLVLRALLETEWPDAFYVFGAPTYRQAKNVYWQDLKLMIPTELRARRPIETELTIELVNGARIACVGMDKPFRIEGAPLNGIVLDEFARMKPEAWDRTVGPMLAERGRYGWAWFVGTPVGRNHFWRLSNFARDPRNRDWSYHHWTSAKVLEPKELARWRLSMDPRLFQQEFEASFVTQEGRAYYSFDRDLHAAELLRYDPRARLGLCFDFNVDNGAAVVVQEQRYSGPNPDVARQVTGVIGQVHIPVNSETPAICARLLEDWGDHEGEVVCYGDPSGGSRGPAKVRGSEWEIIEQELRPRFGSRLSFDVRRSQPEEIRRVNALRRRMKTADGIAHLLIDPAMAPIVADDCENVVLLKGGTGQLDKKSTPEWTHWTDALAYYLERRFGVYSGKPPRPTRTF